MEIKDRIKKIREEKGLSQRAFAKHINVANSTYAQLELGTRVIKDIHIDQICSKFIVNENWLRTGEGEMFAQSDTLSLDDYARQNNLSELEATIIRAYMSLDKATRQSIMQGLEKLSGVIQEKGVVEPEQLLQAFDMEEDIEISPSSPEAVDAYQHFMAEEEEKKRLAQDQSKKNA